MTADRLPAVTGVARPIAPADSDTLTEDAARLVGEGLAANTRTAYAHDWAAYLRWCAERGLDPLPASEVTLANYVAHLTVTPTIKGTPHSPSSIDRAVACILAAHDHAGATKPGTKAARLALRAYRRQQIKAGHRTKKAPPITIERLREIVSAMPHDTVKGRRDRAIVVLGFAMMARRSELAGLDIGDLTFTDDGIEVLVATSKTDKDSAGQTVAIRYGSRRETCPVRVVKAWLADLAAQGITSGAMFRPVDRSGRIGDSGVVRAGRGTGERLTGHGINYIIKQATRAAGLANAGSYSAHGLRSGGATSAAKSGKSLPQIARHGRWDEESTVVAGYVRDTDKWTDNAMSDVGL